jgi:hypothetical protein
MQAAYQHIMDTTIVKQIVPDFQVGTAIVISTGGFGPSPVVVFTLEAFFKVLISSG